MGSPENEEAKVTSCRQPLIYDGAAISASNAGGQVEQFDLATSGALWVATGFHPLLHNAEPKPLV